MTPIDFETIFGRLPESPRGPPGAPREPREGLPGAPPVLPRAPLPGARPGASLAPAWGLLGALPRCLRRNLPVPTRGTPEPPLEARGFSGASPEPAPGPARAPPGAFSEPRPRGLPRAPQGLSLILQSRVVLILRASSAGLASGFPPKRSSRPPPQASSQTTPSTSGSLHVCPQCIAQLPPIGFSNRTEPLPTQAQLQAPPAPRTRTPLHIVAPLQCQSFSVQLAARTNWHARETRNILSALRNFLRWDPQTEPLAPPAQTPLKAPPAPRARTVLYIALRRLNIKIAASHLMPTDVQLAGTPARLGTSPMHRKTSSAEIPEPNPRTSWPKPRSKDPAGFSNPSPAS